MCYNNVFGLSEDESSVTKESRPCLPRAKSNPEEVEARAAVLSILSLWSFCFTDISPRLFFSVYGIFPPISCSVSVPPPITSHPFAFPLSSVQNCDNTL